MRKLFFAGMFTACMAWTAGFSQTAHQIVIKGGHVIDPKNNIDGVLDVAIDSGKITAVAANIDASGASQVVDAKGLLVTPGLIDIHTHVFWGVEPDHQYANGNLAIQPDGFTFRNGVTTIVDAGSSGWRNFATFKAQTIDQSRTRVLAFLNIVGEGMRGGYEQNMNDMDAKMAATIARQYPKDIVGFKLAHYNGHDWTPTERVVAAGRMAGNLPVMIDFGGSTPALSLEKLYLEYLRPGDIYTHCFAQIDGREYIYDTEAKKMKPFTYVARKKGIQFDVGYGGISFAYSQGIGAIKEGFYPNSISTDLHVGSMNAAMKDMLTTMTKFLAMGMPLQAVIEASTWNPAQEIQHKELGHLSVGAIADVAILDLQQGKFGLFDYTGYKLTTDKKLACAMTIRDGRIVYDLNGIAEPVIVGGGRRKPNDKFAEWYQTLPSSNNKKLTPHASINQAEFFRQYQKNPAYWNKAFDYLHTTDLAALKPGTYQIDSGNVFAIVVDAIPNELEKVKWEAHRDFNDLQYIIRGKATMGVASVDDPSGKVIVPYSPTNDILHFSNELGSYYPADQGTFFIFTPLEMHRPGIRAEGKGAIKKVVIKVRVP
ncbi:MAG TPA: amidohydrolase/deacetylase family metallohydrolase [Flavihumibacter sp.]|nr:amidohydrolase/deacetylase family metallohydrolase [Flavihumibacter sp.]